LCEFADDTSFSTLRTLLAHISPSQLLQEKNSLSSVSQAIIHSILGSITTETLRKNHEFLKPDDTIKVLMDVDYLGSSVNEWPDALKELLADVNEPIPKAKAGQELALSALGATLWYLKKCLIDVDLITMRKFHIYSPATSLGTVELSLNM
jgi:DNA mismatch repair protein MSH6